MPRIILGNRSGVLALPQARGVLAELSEGWPDVNLTQKTVRGDSAEGLLEALAAGRVNIALQSLDGLPPQLPEGLTLAAVTKRLEPRAALVSRTAKALTDLAPGSAVGVHTARDRAFLLASRGDLEVAVLDHDVDANLEQLTSGEVAALVVASAHLAQRRERISALLDPAVFTPAAGQGSLGLIVQQDDDLASDLAYTLQHRPSFDRARAERSFARTLRELQTYALGTLATVTSDGDLNLFGAVADMDGQFVLQAEISGEASEAEELGRELAQDVLAQLKQRT